MDPFEFVNFGSDSNNSQDENVDNPESRTADVTTSQAPNVTVSETPNVTVSQVPATTTPTQSGNVDSPANFQMGYGSATGHLHTPSGLTPVNQYATWQMQQQPLYTTATSNQMGFPYTEPTFRPWDSNAAPFASFYDAGDLYGQPSEARSIFNPTANTMAMMHGNAPSCPMYPSHQPQRQWLLQQQQTNPSFGSQLGMRNFLDDDELFVPQLDYQPSNEGGITPWTGLGNQAGENVDAPERAGPPVDIAPRFRQPAVAPHPTQPPTDQYSQLRFRTVAEALGSGGARIQFDVDDDDWREIEQEPRPYIVRMIDAFQRPYKANHPRANLTEDEQGQWTRFQRDHVERTRAHTRDHPELIEINAWRIMAQALEIHRVGVVKAITKGQSIDEQSKCSERLEKIIDAIADYGIVRFDVIRNTRLDDLAANPRYFVSRKVCNFNGNRRKAERDESNAAKAAEAGFDYKTVLGNKRAPTATQTTPRTATRTDRETQASLADRESRKRSRVGNPESRDASEDIVVASSSRTKRH